MQAEITVQYFAVFRDLIGRAKETLHIEAGESAAQLYTRLAEQHAFPLALKDIRVAINDEFGSPEQILKSGDVVVFIPPVAGG